MNIIKQALFAFAIVIVSHQQLLSSNEKNVSQTTSSIKAWRDQKSIAIGFGIGVATGLIAGGTFFVLPYSVAFLASYYVEPTVRQAIVDRAAENYHVNKLKLQKTASIASWIAYLSCPSPRPKQGGDGDIIYNADGRPDNPQAGNQFANQSFQDQGRWIYVPHNQHFQGQGHRLGGPPGGCRVD